MMLPKELTNLITQRQNQNRFRQLQNLPQDCIDFFSNDYLGISKQLANCQEHYQLGGATGSRLISGNSTLAMDLEEYLAEFYQAQSALVYNSGYAANLGVLGCVPQKGDLILYDELSHASMRDGIRLSFAKSYSFLHNNLDDLTKKLNQHAAKNKYIVVESLYSMDGDVLDLTNLIRIATQQNAYIILDEAHATGVLGNNGKGLFSDDNHPRIIARIHTFGKAMGTHGAVVVGTTELINFLINFSRPFIYTTAPSKGFLQEIKLAHDLFLTTNHHQKQLKTNIKVFKDLVLKHQLQAHFAIQPSPIQTYFAPKQLLQQTEKKLHQSNIAVKSIVAPTVPKGKERIRITLHSYNNTQQINQLLNIIKQCKTEYSLQE